MVEKEKTPKLNLSELIDIKALQELQDIFAKTMGVASITVDHEGPITAPSNFTDFCMKYTRGSALGFKRCNECDIKCGKLAAATGNPAIYTCHSGLTDFAVPIMIGGKHLGSILGGQILTEPPDEAHYRELARELGINEDEYIEALRKIKIVPVENIKAAADLLHFVANTISDISLKNLELIRKNKREDLYDRITNTIRSSVNIDETLNFICEEVAKLFNVQRTTIVTFNTPENYEKFTLKAEYKINLDTKGITSDKYVLKSAGYWGHNLFGDGKILAFENIQESDAPDYFKECYKELGVKSIIGCPIKLRNNQWSSLVLSEYDYCRHWTDEEKSQLKTITDQIFIALKQAELYDALKQTTSHQNAILNNMPFMAWLKDYKGRLLAANDSFAAMCNLPVSQLIGKTDFEFWSKELAEDYIKDDLKVIEAGHTIFTEEPISGPDGERWRETIKSPVFDEEGNVIGTVGLARDVTERKQAEFELLRQQKQILKASQRENLMRQIFAIIRSSLDINIIKNKIVTEVGKALNADICFMPIYETSKDYVFVDEFSEYRASSASKSFIGLDTRNAKFAWFIKLLKKNQEINYSNAADFVGIANLEGSPELDFLRKYGIKSSYNIPIFYANNLLGCIILEYTNDYRALDENDLDFLRTIATQAGIAIHQAQLYSTIEKNENYTRTVLDSIKDGIVTINDDFVVESCNPAMENIFGYTNEEIVGKKLDLFLNHNCDDKDKKVCFSKNVSSGIKKNGNEFPVEIDVSEINYNDKNMTLLVIRDVTERKKIEKMKNEFISTVSHELRTPLTSIKGSLGLITSGVLGVLPDKINKMLSIADTNCSRLTNLINDILDLEKIKAGKMEFNYEELEINEIIEQSVILHQPYAEQFKMKIKVNKLVDKAFIKIDKSRMLQVLSNLMSNAVKFSYTGGEVLVSSEREDGKIKISVSDKGIGIPEYSKNKIFNAFSQVDSSDTRAKGGSGLGLSICKLIIEKMGGEIDFESVAEKGSTFFFTMPELTELTPIKVGSLELKELDIEDDSW